MNKRIQIFPSPAGTASVGWMVQSDFDGTISLLDVTDTLLNRFGKPGWQDLEDAWECGDIGSRECMKGQVALLDMSEAELQNHLDGIEIDEHFAGFVADTPDKMRALSMARDFAEGFGERVGRAVLSVLLTQGLGDLLDGVFHGHHRAAQVTVIAR